METIRVTQEEWDARKANSDFITDPKNFPPQKFQCESCGSDLKDVGHLEIHGRNGPRDPHPGLYSMWDFCDIFCLRTWIELLDLDQYREE